MKKKKYVNKGRNLNKEENVWMTHDESKKQNEGRIAREAIEKVVEKVKEKCNKKEGWMNERKVD